MILLNIQEHSLCEICAVYLKAADGRTLELRAASTPPHAASLLPALAIDEARADAWCVAEPVQDGRNLRAFYADRRAAGKTRCLFQIDPRPHARLPACRSPMSRDCSACCMSATTARRR